MNEKLAIGILIDESTELSLRELCTACSREVEWIIELVEEGVLDPVGTEPEHWRFSAVALSRVYTATRLHHDLGINTAGIALALDLLEELNVLRAKTDLIESQYR